MATAGDQQTDTPPRQFKDLLWPNPFDPNEWVYPEVDAASLKVVADLPEDWYIQECKYLFEHIEGQVDCSMEAAIAILRSHAAGRRVCDADGPDMPTDFATESRNEILRASIAELTPLWRPWILGERTCQAELERGFGNYPLVFEAWDAAARGLASFSFNVKRLYECECRRKHAAAECLTHLPIIEEMELRGALELPTVTAACEAFFKEYRIECERCGGSMRFQNIVLDRLPPFLMVHYTSLLVSDGDVQKHVDSLQPFRYRNAQHELKMCRYSKISAYIVCNGIHTVPVFGQKGRYWIKDSQKGYPPIHSNADFGELLRKHAHGGAPFAIAGVLLSHQMM